MVVLSPGESFWGEKGCLIMKDSGISVHSEYMGAKSLLSGERIFILRFSNNSSRDRCLWISGQNTHLLHIKNDGEELFVRSGAYVASTSKVRLKGKVTSQTLKTRMSLQKIEGESSVFVEHQGDLICKQLAKGEIYEVDENHFLAVKGMPISSIEVSWKINRLWQREGLSLIKVVGPGAIYISPTPMSNHKDPITILIFCFFFILYLLFLFIPQLLVR